MPFSRIRPLAETSVPRKQHPCPFMKMVTYPRNVARLVLPLLLLAIGQSRIAKADAPPVDFATFQNPPAEFRGIHWVGLMLSQVTEPSLVASVKAGGDAGFWGSTMMG